MLSKNDYYINALNNGLYKERDWIISGFTIPVDDYEPRGEYELGLDEGQWYTHINGERVDIDAKSDYDSALFKASDKLDIHPDDVINLREERETSYGSLVFNYITFIYSCGDKIDYLDNQAGIQGNTLEKVIEKALSNDVITVDEYLKFMEGMGHLTVFADFIIPVGSVKLQRASKEALALRDKLVEQYKDQLDDPATAAYIEQEVIKLDKEYMADDPAMGFLLKGKAFNTVRKKMLYMQGAMPRLDEPGKVDFIATSLYEGIDPKDLPAIINNLRSGSYDRGKSTALGGYAAKQLARTFQNTAIRGDDCGATTGIEYLVESFDYDAIVGFYPPGRDTPYTEEEAKGLIGKVVKVRLPTNCLVPGDAYCKKCMGDAIGNSNLAISAQASAPGNVFMKISLAAFHAKEQTLIEYTPDRIS